MKKNNKYDFVIIGAGIAGLSGAYHLAKDGYSVVVLESGSGKENASFASTAEMNHDPEVEWQKVISRFGLKGAKDLWKLSERGIRALSAFAHRKNAEHFNTDRVPAHLFALDKKGKTMLRKKFELYKKIGGNVSWTEVASVIHKYFYSAFTIKDEGTTNNQAILRTLARAVRSHKGKIRFHTEVKKITEKGAGVIVETKNGTQFTGARVLVATGDLKLIPALNKLIDRVRSFVVRYKNHTMPRLFRSSILWDTASPYHYIRSFRGFELWVGGEDVSESSYRKSDEKMHARNVDAYAKKVLGLNASFKKKGGWSGVFFPTHRGLPYIGRIENSRIFVSAGFGGSGILMSFMSGFLHAAWLKNKELSYKKLFSIDA